VILSGLRAFGHHGVFDHERQYGQEFVIDAVLSVDTKAAAASDDLTLTVDYVRVAAVIVSIVSGEPVQLIETLAGRLATACLATSPMVREVEITVHKPQAPLPHPFADVAVIIRRSRS
jgi:7,8-dihydroneopterin aldolase/epimerase/oxygenase